MQQRIDENALHPDPVQLKATKRLQRLQDALLGYDNVVLIELREGRAAQDNTEPTSEAVSSEQLPQIRIPRGLYLYGSVGIGKSMLMDLFYATTPIHKKQRYHFHDFLADVHSRIHRLQQRDSAAWGRNNLAVDPSLETNPIRRVAMQVSREVTLLCLDEFQVTDIADAVILSQFFSVLFERGTVIVTTSNRPPQDLYEGGLNRGYFLPFIDMLERHCIVHSMTSTQDYRQLLSENVESYCFVTQNETRSTQLDALVDRLRNGKSPKPVHMSVGSRQWVISNADDDRMVARLDFDEICGKEYGASDYRVLAETFATVVIDHIPVLTLQDHNRARRFITLIDELYEARVLLACSAVAEPNALFVHVHVDGGGGVEAPEIDRNTKWIDQVVSGGHSVGALASVKELAFAFARAASRLREMTSATWWDRWCASPGDRGRSTTTGVNMRAR